MDFEFFGLFKVFYESVVLMRIFFVDCIVFLFEKICIGIFLVVLIFINLIMI